MIVGASLQGLILYILGCISTIDSSDAPPSGDPPQDTPVAMPNDDLPIQSRLAITGALSSVIIIVAMRIAAQIRGPEVKVDNTAIIEQYTLCCTFLNPLIGLIFGIDFWQCLLYSYFIPVGEFLGAIVVYMLLAFVYWLIYP